MTKLGKRLIQAAKEANAFAKGELDITRIYIPGKIYIRQLESGYWLATSRDPTLRLMFVYEPTLKKALAAVNEQDAYLRRLEMKGQSSVDDIHAQLGAIELQNSILSGKLDKLCALVAELRLDLLERRISRLEGLR